ncbi:MAG: galactokinase [Ginsengibacter sp.]
MSLAAAFKVKKAFGGKFLQKPRLYYSPGRINLIGEHIDYNDGFVMPAAIDKGIYYAIALNDSDDINFYSTNFDETLSIKTSGVERMDGWKNYVLGVLNEFQLLHFPVNGFNCVFGGNIPIGAGISSSAALEGGLAYGLNELNNYQLNRKELALLCQRAEHNFPRVMCGIMDQYASIMGKKDHVILLDCRSITHEYVPLHLPGYKIVLINSRVHHSLASSEYNRRRNECEEGMMIMREEMNVQSFRDVTKAEDLLTVKDKMSYEVYERCLYVVEEIKRTKDAANFLKENNLNAFGKLMFKTHEGLSNLYQVSCRELDFLVDKAAKNKNVVGARLMGGGFGGCTINVVQEGGKAEFLSKILADYKDEFNIDAEVYEVTVVDGTHEMIDVD